MADTLNTQEPHDLIASDRVEGTTVYDTAGEKLGSVKNFMVGKRSGRVEYAVIEFGGILGIGSDYFPVPWDVLKFDPERGGYVVNLTKQQLDEAPRHGAEYPEYDHNYGRRIFDYYGIAYPYPFI